MNKFLYVVAFACGAIVGAVAMDYYRNRQTKVIEAEPEEGEFEETDENPFEEVPPREDIVVFKEIAEDSGYKTPETSSTTVLTTHPYFLDDPEEFGTLEDYDTINLTLYSDGTLADDQGDAMDQAEIARSVGADFMSHFGGYEDNEDVIYIRNDEYCCDFEICKDLRTYAEIDEERPHLKWRDDE